jgi:hypothetical protein
MYGTVAGATNFAKSYFRKDPPGPFRTFGKHDGFLERPWPSRAFEVTFDQKTHLWTVTGSCRMDTKFEGVMTNSDGIRDARSGPGKSWEWNWKLVLSYNPSTQGYEAPNVKYSADYYGMTGMRPARMDDYGKWIQGRFTKPGRSADSVTALRLVLDVPEQTKFGLEPKYSYGKNKMAAESTPRGVTVSIGDPGAGGQAERWTLLFEAPVAHSLKVGEYGGAWWCGRDCDVGPLIRVAHSPLDRGKQTWNSETGAWGSGAGEFVVREIELQDQKVVRFAIDFITDSEYGLPSTDKRDSRHILRGSLRYNSQFELSIPELARDAAE